MDAPIKLLVMDVRWPPETFLMRKFAALAESGYHIAVLTQDGEAAQGGGSVEVIRVPRSIVQFSRTASLLLRATLSSPSRAWGATWGVLHSPEARGKRFRLLVRAWAMEAWRPDVVHFEWTFAATAALALMKRGGRHFVVSCRGAHVSVAPHNPERHCEAAQLSEAFERSCRVHCVSDAIRRDAEDAGLGTGKASIIRPAVQPALYVPAERKPCWSGVRVAMTGAFIWRKGMEYGLHALRHALDQGLAARLEIAGGGDKQNLARVLYTIEDLGLKDHVELLGARDERWISNWLAECDLFLHSSLSEGISNAVLEAMACGLPVVTTDAGGMREAVRDGLDGYVVPCRDVEVMGDALVRLGRDGELRMRMGKSARERVLEEFTLERQTREWRALYEGLLEDCHHR